MKWMKIGERKNIVTFLDLVSLGVYDEKCKEILGFKLGVNAFRNYCYEIGYKDHEFKQGVEIIKKQLKEKTPRYFINLTKKLGFLGNKLVNYCLTLQNKTFNSKQELKQAIITIQNLARDYSPALVIANVIEPVIETNLRLMINEKEPNPDLQKEYFQILTTTELIDETEQELDELRDIQINKTPIDNHIKKWGWIFQGRSGEALTKEQIESRLKKEISKKSIKEKKQEIKLKSQEIIKKINIDPDYVELVKTYVYFRTHRMNLFLKSSFYMSYLLKEISKQTEWDYQIVRNMLFHEIINLLNNKYTDQNQFKQRLQQKNISFLSQDGVMSVEIIKNLKDESITGIKEIKGSTAFAGYAKGTVKIIQEISDIKKVQQGDVLVASMTIPEFVPAMERAAAFVTNEGGILCHAAIIAREMKKPCIIGTKIATRALRDGDIVEVNADKGIVTKQ